MKMKWNDKYTWQLFFTLLFLGMLSIGFIIAISFLINCLLDL